ncbi:hypothetical protein DFH11DRAFT_1796705 [Phellopilus nigrolimitatus]|nr:hypothetical protein DFH11DRAFT_1796705 [Phellopilus nigrolimitatus]
MESTLFDAVTVSSDSSLPQTPSPRSSVILDHPFDNLKPPVDFEPLESHSIFADAYNNYPDSEPITHSMENPAMWNGPHAGPFFASQRQGNHGGSLLQELHGQDYMDHLDAYSPPPLTSGSEWNGTPAPLPHPALPPHMQHEHSMSRRASFPSVRHDRDESMHHVLPHYMQDEPGGHYGAYASRDAFYAEPLSMDSGSPQPALSAEPSALHGHMHLGSPPHLEESYLCGSVSPHPSYREMEEGIKLEDAAPVIVPSQHIFYPRPPSQAGQLPPMPLYMAPHAAIPIQHTDDAASKETQYLRRRCFNCHTTEPPSWRRSTLNPGKIVCNKCGLYERTHLRPRPQRFDELRAGNKSRKHSSAKILSGSTSPKEQQQQQGSVVKKEQGEYEFDAPSRRGSVSSSSVHSASSDFDDNVSIYSSVGSTSGMESYNNSPLISSFSIPRISPSSSPQMNGSEVGGIRLPNAPFNDIASVQSISHSPRKAATVPYFNSNGRPISPASSVSGSDYMNMRRGSMPVDSSHNASPLMNGGSALGLPEVTGWQPVPLGDLDSKSARSRSSSRKPLAT